MGNWRIGWFSRVERVDRVEVGNGELADWNFVGTDLSRFHR